MKHNNSALPEPTFKLASIANIEKLMKLMSELYAYDRLTFDEQAARLALNLILGNNLYGYIYLICINEEIVGYLVITFGFSLEYRGLDAFVDELYIQENYRRQGIGKKSLQFAEQLCQKQGIQALHLEVERENFNAQALYQKAGFIAHDRYLLTKYL